MTATVHTPVLPGSPEHCQFRWCLGEDCGQTPGEGDVAMHLGRPSSIRGLDGVIAGAQASAFTEYDGTLAGVPMITLSAETDTFDAEVDLAVGDALAFCLALTAFANDEQPVGSEACFEGVAGGEPSGATVTVRRVSDMTIGRKYPRTFSVIELRLHNPDGNPERGVIQMPGCNAAAFARYLLTIAGEVTA